MLTIPSARFEEVESSRDSCVIPSEMANDTAVPIHVALEFILLTFTKGVSSRGRYGSKADGGPAYARIGNYQT